MVELRVPSAGPQIWQNGLLVSEEHLHLGGVVSGGQRHRLRAHSMSLRPQHTPAAHLPWPRHLTSFSGCRPQRKAFGSQLWVGLDVISGSALTSTEQWPIHQATSFGSMQAKLHSMFTDTGVTLERGGGEQKVAGNYT